MPTRRAPCSCSQGLSRFLETLEDIAFARRLSAHVEPQYGTWCPQRCNGRHVVSWVLDVSVRGLFVETEEPAPTSWIGIFSFPRFHAPIFSVKILTLAQISLSHSNRDHPQPLEFSLATLLRWILLLIY